MSANLQSESGHSVAELVSGIVHDAQNLLSQQLALFKQEVREDINKAREAASFLALASGLLLVGVLLLCFMIVYILHELASLPLWGSFAIVGGVLTAAGIVLGFLGREQLRTVHAVPEKTAKALEENLEWKTKPT
jgi:hypothetical protein